ncbi:hypothetical protein TYRP_012254 [Tyrophagus putrescentiae]|nr:hypothetical protein TYRP_012254 [Tyrophagus putrescentiae]
MLRVNHVTNEKCHTAKNKGSDNARQNKKVLFRHPGGEDEDIEKVYYKLLHGVDEDATRFGNLALISTEWIISGTEKSPQNDHFQPPAEAEKCDILKTLKKNLKKSSKLHY